MGSDFFCCWVVVVFCMWREQVQYFWSYCVRSVEVQVLLDPVDKCCVALVGEVSGGDVFVAYEAGPGGCGK